MNEETPDLPAIVFRPSLRAVRVQTAIVAVVLAGVSIFGAMSIYLTGPTVFGVGYCAIGAIGVAAFLWTFTKAHQYVVEFQSEQLIVRSRAGSQRATYDIICGLDRDSTEFLLTTSRGKLRVESICFNSFRDADTFEHELRRRCRNLK